MKKISKGEMGASSFALVLALLKKNDTYGYQIMQELEQLSSGMIVWKEGSLYPVLKKMESRKLIKSLWNVKDFDRPRKYYKILPKGIEELENLLEERKLVSDIISQILNSD
jgi:DNA-binding PadR family transcriptional regulator